MSSVSEPTSRPDSDHTPRYKPAKDWYTPPPEWPLRGPVPKTCGPPVVKSLTVLQRSLREFLTDPKYAERNSDYSYFVRRAPAFASIAEHFNVHVSTVRRNMHALVDKKIVQIYAVWANDREGGRRAGTSLFFPTFANTLKARLDDPRIAKTEQKKPLILGNGKRFMTPEEAAEWQIKLDRVPEHAEIEDAGEPAIAADSGEAEAVAATASRGYDATRSDDAMTHHVAPPVATMATPPVIEDPLAPIREAMESVGCHAEDQDAAMVLNVALAKDATIRRKTEEPLSIAIAAELVELAGAERRKLHPHSPITPGLYQMILPRRVQSWRQAFRRDESEREKREAQAKLRSETAWMEELRDDPVAYAAKMNEFADAQESREKKKGAA